MRSFKAGIRAIHFPKAGGSVNVNLFDVDPRAKLLGLATYDLGGGGPPTNLTLASVTFATDLIGTDARQSGLISFSPSITAFLAHAMNGLGFALPCVMEVLDNQSGVKETRYQRLEIFFDGANSAYGATAFYTVDNMRELPGIAAIKFDQGDGSKANVNLSALLGPRAKIVGASIYAGTSNTTTLQLGYATDGAGTGKRVIHIRNAPVNLGLEKDLIVSPENILPVRLEVLNNQTSAKETRFLIADVTFGGVATDGSVFIYYTND